MSQKVAFSFVEVFSLKMFDCHQIYHMFVCLSVLTCLGNCVQAADCGADHVHGAVPAGQQLRRPGRHRRRPLLRQQRWHRRPGVLQSDNSVLQSDNSVLQSDNSLPQSDNSVLQPYNISKNLSANGKARIKSSSCAGTRT